MQMINSQQWHIAQHGWHDKDTRVDGMRDIVAANRGDYLPETDLLIELIFTFAKRDVNYIDTAGFKYICMKILGLDVPTWQNIFKRLHRMG